MDTTTVTLVGGALVVLLVVAKVVFHRTLPEKLLGLFGKLGLVAGLIGWLMMWFTQEPIWSSAPRTCTAFASIELKGQVYRTCSYLVHRYQAGEWLFYAGLAAFAVCILLDRLTKRRA